MHKFTILFWWGTDLRCKCTVEASDELRALAKALDAQRFGRWITDQPFRVEIVWGNEVEANARNQGLAPQKGKSQ